MLYGRVLLEPSLTGINETPFRFATEHIVAGRFLKAAAVDIAALIVKAKAGEMDGLDGVVSLAAETSGPFSAYFAPIYHPFISDGPRLPSLLIRGMAKHNLLVTSGDSRQLDWEM